MNWQVPGRFLRGRGVGTKAIEPGFNMKRPAMDGSA